jgi:hypothetical protein
MRFRFGYLIRITIRRRRKVFLSRFFRMLGVYTFAFRFRLGLGFSKTPLRSAIGTLPIGRKVSGLEGPACPLNPPRHPHFRLAGLFVLDFDFIGFSSYFASVLYPKTCFNRLLYWLLLLEPNAFNSAIGPSLMFLKSLASCCHDSK